MLRVQLSNERIDLVLRSLRRLLLRTVFFDEHNIAVFTLDAIHETIPVLRTPFSLIRRGDGGEVLTLIGLNRKALYYFLLLTSNFLFLISYFLLLSSYFLLLTYSPSQISLIATFQLMVYFGSLKSISKNPR